MEREYQYLSVKSLRHTETNRKIEIDTQRQRDILRERQTLTIRSLETDRQRERHIYKETQ